MPPPSFAAENPVRGRNRQSRRSRLSGDVPHHPFQLFRLGLQRRIQLYKALALRDLVYSVHRLGAEHTRDTSLNPCGQRLPLLCDFPPLRAARGFFIDEFIRHAAVLDGQRFAAGRARWGGIVQGSVRGLDAETIRCEPVRVKRIRPYVVNVVNA